MPEQEITLSQEIGERVRYARQSKGLSLGQLSELTGDALSKSRISNYEQGIRRMSIEAARPLARALGTCTAAYLLCVDDPMNLTADEIDLIQKYRATDAKGRASVRNKANVEAKRVAEKRVYGVGLASMTAGAVVNDKTTSLVARFRKEICAALMEL